ncbi:MAG: TSUP family transporter [Candidatus Nanopelagicales bacterium]
MVDSGWALAILCIVAFVAGWVDAVSGGGGLLQVPALLIAVPADSPTSALGTNKLSSIGGTFSAAVTYARREAPDLRTALPMAATAFVGAGVGALIALRLPVEVLRPFIVIALALVWFLIAFRSRWAGERVVAVSDRKRWGTAIIGGGVIGVYDGMLGPGTGAFLIVLLVAALGYSYLRASATAKFVNVGTNAAALIVFGLGGSVLWLVGVVMGACNVAGGIVGARTALARGSGFVRIVLLVVVAVLLVTLSVDLLVR